MRTMLCPATLIFSLTIYLWKCETSSGQFSNGFLYVQNWTTEPFSVLRKFGVSSSCQCRRECFENEECVMYTNRTVNELYTECFVRFRNDWIPFSSDVQSLVGVKVGYPDISLGSDNLFYWYPIGNFSFNDAKSICLTRSPFRLGIFKTVANLAILQKFSLDSQVWVDLTKTATLDGMWGDATMYNTTEISNIIGTDIGVNNSQPAFRWKVSSSRFQDDFINGSFQAICQADLLQTSYFADSQPSPRTSLTP